MQSNRRQQEITPQQQDALRIYLEQTGFVNMEEFKINMYEEDPTDDEKVIVTFQIERAKIAFDKKDPWNF